MKTTYGRSLRLISTILIVAFACQDLAWAAPDFKAVKFSFDQKLSLRYSFPESVARVEDSFKSKEHSRTIFLLQDAHTNESGQLNLAKTLETLLEREEGLRFVFSEAAVGDNSLDYLRPYRPLEERKELARRYVRKGLLHGTEYLQLTTEADFVLWGVEKPEQYIQALEDYKQIAKERERFDLYLKKIESSLETLKQRLLNPSLLEFDAKFQKYQKEELSLTDYFDVLAKEASLLDISLSEYPNLGKLQTLKDQEGRIDFKAANEEQTKAVRSLSKEDREELKGFAGSEKNLPAKLMPQNQDREKAYYALLEEKIKNRPGVYPELLKYFSYLNAARRIDAHMILSEMKILEEKIFSARALTQDEKTLVRCSQVSGYLYKLFHLTLVPEEFKEYQANASEFGIERLTGFLNKKIMDLGMYYDRALFLEPGYEEMVKRSENFYALTFQRDENFLTETLSKMDQENQQKAVLVTGGFHTANLKALLKTKGISFVSIAPQVYSETNMKLYEGLLLNQNMLQAPNLRAALPSSSGVMTGHYPSASLLPVPQGARLMMEDFAAETAIPQIAAAKLGAGARLSLAKGSTENTVKILKEASLTPKPIFYMPIFDKVVSGFAIIIFILPMFFIAGAISLTRTGPVIFNQDRLKLGAEVFRMRKFRTLMADSKTPISLWGFPLGKFLRTTRLDEIPQFFHVWDGDMAIFGPRPLAPDYISSTLIEYPQVSKELSRHVISRRKPGLLSLEALRELSKKGAGDSTLLLNQTEKIKKYLDEYIASTREENERWSAGFAVGQILIPTIGAFITLFFEKEEAADTKNEDAQGRASGARLSVLYTHAKKIILTSFIFFTLFSGYGSITYSQTAAPSPTPKPVIERQLNERPSTDLEIRTQTEDRSERKSMTTKVNKVYDKRLKKTIRFSEKVLEWQKSSNRFFSEEISSGRMKALKEDGFRGFNTINREVQYNAAVKASQKTQSTQEVKVLSSQSEKSDQSQTVQSRPRIVIDASATPTPTPSATPGGTTAGSGGGSGSGGGNPPIINQANVVPTPVPSVSPNNNPADDKDKRPAEIFRFLNFDALVYSVGELNRLRDNSAALKKIDEELSSEQSEIDNLNNPQYFAYLSSEERQQKIKDAQKRILRLNKAKNDEQTAPRAQLDYLRVVGKMLSDSFLESNKVNDMALQKELQDLQADLRDMLINWKNLSVGDRQALITQWLDRAKAFKKSLSEKSEIPSSVPLIVSESNDDLNNPILKAFQEFAENALLLEAGEIAPNQVLTSFLNLETKINGALEGEDGKSIQLAKELKIFLEANDFSMGIGSGISTTQSENLNSLAGSFGIILKKPSSRKTVTLSGTLPTQVEAGLVPTVPVNSDPVNLNPYDYYWNPYGNNNRVGNKKWAVKLPSGFDPIPDKSVNSAIPIAQLPPDVMIFLSSLTSDRVSLFDRFFGTTIGRTLGGILPNDLKIIEREIRKPGFRIDRFLFALNSSKDLLDILRRKDLSVRQNFIEYMQRVHQIRVPLEDFDAIEISPALQRVLFKAVSDDVNIFQESFLKSDVPIQDKPNDLSQNPEPKPASDIWGSLERYSQEFGFAILLLFVFGGPAATYAYYRWKIYREWKDYRSWQNPDNETKRNEQFLPVLKDRIREHLETLEKKLEDLQEKMGEFSGVSKDFTAFYRTKLSGQLSAQDDRESVIQLFEKLDSSLLRQLQDPQDDRSLDRMLALWQEAYSLRTEVYRVDELLMRDIKSMDNLLSRQFDLADTEDKRKELEALRAVYEGFDLQQTNLHREVMDLGTRSGENLYLFRNHYLIHSLARLQREFVGLLDGGISRVASEYKDAGNSDEILSEIKAARETLYRTEGVPDEFAKQMVTFIAPVIFKRGFRLDPSAAIQVKRRVWGDDGEDFEWTLYSLKWLMALREYLLLNRAYETIDEQEAHYGDWIKVIYEAIEGFLDQYQPLDQRELLSAEDEISEDLASLESNLQEYDKKLAGLGRFQADLVRQLRSHTAQSPDMRNAAKVFKSLKDSDREGLINLNSQHEELAFQFEEMRDRSIAMVRRAAEIEAKVQKFKQFASYQSAFDGAQNENERWAQEAIQNLESRLQSVVLKTDKRDKALVKRLATLVPWELLLKAVMVSEEAITVFSLSLERLKKIADDSGNEELISENRRLERSLNSAGRSPQAFIVSIFAFIFEKSLKSPGEFLNLDKAHSLAALNLLVPEALKKNPAIFTKYSSGWMNHFAYVIQSSPAVLRQRTQSENLLLAARELRAIQLTIVLHDASTWLGRLNTRVKVLEKELKEFEPHMRDVTSVWHNLQPAAFTDDDPLQTFWNLNTDSLNDLFKGAEGYGRLQETFTHFIDSLTRLKKIRREVIQTVTDEFGRYEGGFEGAAADSYQKFKNQTTGFDRGIEAVDGLSEQSAPLMLYFERLFEATLLFYQLTEAISGGLERAKSEGDIETETSAKESEEAIIQSMPIFVTTLKLVTYIFSKLLLKNEGVNYLTPRASTLKSIRHFDLSEEFENKIYSAEWLEMFKKAVGLASIYLPGTSINLYSPDLISAILTSMTKSLLRLKSKNFVIDLSVPLQEDEAENLIIQVGDENGDQDAAGARLSAEMEKIQKEIREWLESREMVVEESKTFDDAGEGVWVDFHKEDFHERRSDHEFSIWVNLSEPEADGEQKTRVRLFDGEAVVYEGNVNGWDKKLLAQAALKLNQLLAKDEKRPSPKGLNTQPANPIILEQGDFREFNFGISADQLRKIFGSPVKPTDGARLAGGEEMNWALYFVYLGIALVVGGWALLAHFAEKSKRQSLSRMVSLYEEDVKSFKEEALSLVRAAGYPDDKDPFKSFNKDLIDPGIILSDPGKLKELKNLLGRLKFFEEEDEYHFNKVYAAGLSLGKGNFDYIPLVNSLFRRYSAAYHSLIEYEYVVNVTAERVYESANIFQNPSPNETEPDNAALAGASPAAEDLAEWWLEPSQFQGARLGGSSLQWLKWQFRKGRYHKIALQKAERISREIPYDDPKEYSSVLSSRINTYINEIHSLSDQTLFGRTLLTIDAVAGKNPNLLTLSGYAGGLHGVMGVVLRGKKGAYTVKQEVLSKFIENIEDMDRLIRAAKRKNDYRPVAAPLDILYQKAGARLATVSFEDVIKEISPTLESTIRVIALTAQWLEEIGFPHSEVVKLYAKAVELAWVSDDFVKTRNIYTGEISVGVNPKSFKEFITLIQEYDRDPVANFITELVPVIVREAFGYQFIARYVPDMGRYHELHDRIGRFHTMNPGHMNTADEVFQKEVLFENMPRITDLTAEMIVGEYVEVWNQLQAYRWLKSSGHISGPSGALEWVESGDPVELIQYELMHQAAGIAKKYFLGTDTLVNSWIYGLFFSLETALWKATGGGRGFHPRNLHRIVKDEDIPFEDFLMPALSLLPNVRKILNDNDLLSEDFGYKGARLSELDAELSELRDQLDILERTKNSEASIKTAIGALERLMDALEVSWEDRENGRLQRNQDLGGYGKRSILEGEDIEGVYTMEKEPRLVRDKTIDRRVLEGKNPKWHPANYGEFAEALIKKLKEEYGELADAVEAVKSGKSGVDLISRYANVKDVLLALSVQMQPALSEPDIPAYVVAAAFNELYSKFREITSEAKTRFEKREWEESLAESKRRLHIYGNYLDSVEPQLEGMLGEDVLDKAVWEKIRNSYKKSFSGKYEEDLALTFFYSVMRRIFTKKSVTLEYSDDGFSDHREARHFDELYRVYKYPKNLASVLKKIVEDADFKADFEDLSKDTRLGGSLISEGLLLETGATAFDEIQVLKPVFFRNKGAYIVGRILSTGASVPVIIALLNGPNGITIDAVITSKSEVRNIFSSTRTSFLVDTPYYRELADFLKTTMPENPSVISVIYGAIGFLHPQKIEFIKYMRRKIKALRGSAKFENARGTAGTAMMVFTIPSLGYVFKLVRDTSSKESFKGKRGVIEQYKKVHRMDRVGRMLDTMTFHDLQFDRAMFPDEMIAEMMRSAGTSVVVTDDQVILKHVYVQREVTPLPIFIHDPSIPIREKIAVMIDLGYLIRDLTRAGIFYGDYLLKNFGVTKTGRRVVTYDLDDVDDLSEFLFKRMPAPRDEYEEMMDPSEWMSIGDRDVFPEQFATTLIPKDYQEIVNAVHKDIFEIDFWNESKALYKAGHIQDFFPYNQENRLRNRFPNAYTQGARLSASVLRNHTLTFVLFWILWFIPAYSPLKLMAQRQQSKDAIFIKSRPIKLTIGQPNDYEVGKGTMLMMSSGDKLKFEIPGFDGFLGVKLSGISYLSTGSVPVEAQLAVKIKDGTGEFSFSKLRLKASDGKTKLSSGSLTLIEKFSFILIEFDIEKKSPRAKREFVLTVKKGAEPVFTVGGARLALEGDGDQIANRVYESAFSQKKTAAERRLRQVTNFIILSGFFIAAALNPYFSSKLLTETGSWAGLAVLSGILGVVFLETFGYIYHRYFQHIGFWTRQWSVIRASQKIHADHHMIQYAYGENYQSETEYVSSEENAFSWKLPGSIVSLLTVGVGFYVAGVSVSSAVSAAIFLAAAVTYAKFVSSTHDAFHIQKNAFIDNPFLKKWFLWTAARHLRHHRDQAAVNFGITNYFLDYLLGSYESAENYQKEFQKLFDPEEIAVSNLINYSVILREADPPAYAAFLLDGKAHPRIVLDIDQILEILEIRLKNHPEDEFAEDFRARAIAYLKAVDSQESRDSLMRHDSGARLADGVIHTFRTGVLKHVRIGEHKSEELNWSLIAQALREEGRSESEIGQFRSLIVPMLSLFYFNSKRGTVRSGPRTKYLSEFMIPTLIGDKSFKEFGSYAVFVSAFVSSGDAWYYLSAEDYPRDEKYLTALFEAFMRHYSRAYATDREDFVRSLAVFYTNWRKKKEETMKAAQNYRLDWSGTMAGLSAEFVRKSGWFANYTPVLDDATMKTLISLYGDDWLPEDRSKFLAHLTLVLHRKLSGRLVKELGETYANPMTLNTDGKKMFFRIHRALAEHYEVARTNPYQDLAIIEKGLGYDLDLKYSLDESSAPAILTIPVPETPLPPPTKRNTGGKTQEEYGRSMKVKTRDAMNRLYFLISNFFSSTDRDGRFLENLEKDIVDLQNTQITIRSTSKGQFSFSNKRREVFPDLTNQNIRFSGLLPDQDYKVVPYFDSEKGAVIYFYSVNSTSVYEFSKEDILSPKAGEVSAVFITRTDSFDLAAQAVANKKNTALLEKVLREAAASVEGGPTPEIEAAFNDFNTKNIRIMPEPDSQRFIERETGGVVRAGDFVSWTLPADDTYRVSVRWEENIGPAVYFTDPRGIVRAQPLISKRKTGNLGRNPNWNAHPGIDEARRELEVLEGASTPRTAGYLPASSPDPSNSPVFLAGARLATTDRAGNKNTNKLNQHAKYWGIKGRGKNESVNDFLKRLREAHQETRALKKYQGSLNGGQIPGARLGKSDSVSSVDLSDSALRGIADANQTILKEARTLPILTIQELILLDLVIKKETGGVYLFVSRKDGTVYRQLDMKSLPKEEAEAAKDAIRDLQDTVMQLNMQTQETEMSLGGVTMAEGKRAFFDLDLGRFQGNETALNTFIAQLVQFSKTTKGRGSLARFTGTDAQIREAQTRLQDLNGKYGLEISMFVTKAPEGDIRYQEINLFSPETVIAEGRAAGQYNLPLGEIQPGYTLNFMPMILLANAIARSSDPVSESGILHTFGQIIKTENISPATFRTILDGSASIDILNSFAIQPILNKAMRDVTLQYRLLQNLLRAA